MTPDEFPPALSNCRTRPLRQPRWALVFLSALVAACGETSVFEELPRLAATVKDGLVQLSWSEGRPATIASLLVRFPAKGIEGAPERGRSYQVGDSVGTGIIVFDGKGGEALDRPLCTEQVYARWTRDAAGNWSLDPETVRVTGLDFTIPRAPSALTARFEGPSVALSWTSPAGPNPTSYRVVRQRGAPPAGPSSGERVFSGTGTSTTDASAELSPDVTWHYAAYACTPCDECGAAGAQAAGITPTLVQSLRAGGFVIFWRHGTATQCEDRRDLGLASEAKIQEWWMSCDKDCSTALARQLSPQGVTEATTIGAGIKSQGIPFDRVLTSEYCRCRETAALMDLGPPIETTPLITFFVYEDVILSRCGAARLEITRQPAAGKNTAIVAHVYEECALQGIDLNQPSGHAVVYRPDRMGGARLVARVAPEQWAALR